MEKIKEFNNQDNNLTFEESMKKLKEINNQDKNLTFEESMKKLKEFNQQANNNLTLENINYLESLTNAIDESIRLLNNFNINSLKFIQIKNCYGNEYNTNKFNQMTTISTINFLQTTKNFIFSLKINPVKNKNNQIRDEYCTFHNNIIMKIKEFINTYIEYMTIVEKIKNSIFTKLSDETISINILISNYNNNSVCRADPNFNLKYSQQKQKADELQDFVNYLNNDINIFITVRKIFKNINTNFLKLLKM